MNDDLLDGACWGRNVYRQVAECQGSETACARARATRLASPNALRSKSVSLRALQLPEIRKDILGFAFDYSYYDAMSATLQALARVHGDLSGGERKFMAALGKVVLDAPNGRTALSPDHQAIAPTSLTQAVAPPVGARMIATILRVDHTFGGYFRPNDAPPSESTPVCKHGNPPSWAR
jgi:hypothetical protein